MSEVETGLDALSALCAMTLDSVAHEVRSKRPKENDRISQKSSFHVSDCLGFQNCCCRRSSKKLPDKAVFMCFSLTRQRRSVCLLNTSVANASASKDALIRDFDRCDRYPCQRLACYPILSCALTRGIVLHLNSLPKPRVLEQQSGASSPHRCQ